jgi:hypothetical protein
MKPFVYSGVELNQEKDHFIGIMDGMHYLIKENGSSIKNIKYTEMKWYTNTLCLFVENGKIGIVDITGKIIQEAKFEGFQDNQKSDGNQYSIIAMNGKEGFINLKGEIVIECKFDEVGAFKNGYAPVVLNGKKGYINVIGVLLN